MRRGGTIVEIEGDDSHSDLSWVLGPEDEGFPGWSAGELEEILKHQLETFLAVDIGNRLLEPDRALAGSGSFQGLRSMKFGELLLHPRPPVEALDLVKDLAKARRNDPEGLLPPEVATVLYYGSICAAALRHGIRISTLDRGALRAGLEWALSREWVTGPIRGHFVEARAYLAKEEADPGP